MKTVNITKITVTTTPTCDIVSLHLDIPGNHIAKVELPFHDGKGWAESHFPELMAEQNKIFT